MKWMEFGGGMERERKNGDTFFFPYELTFFFFFFFFPSLYLSVWDMGWCSSLPDDPILFVLFFLPMSLLEITTLYIC